MVPAKKGTRTPHTCRGRGQVVVVGGGGGGGGGGGRVNGFLKADLSTRVNSRSVEVRGYTLSGRGACQLHGTAVLTDSGPRGNERLLSRIR